jgi:SpoVK/Ycf46/Vps4 family AAA+-type ATPase
MKKKITKKISKIYTQENLDALEYLSNTLKSVNSLVLKVRQEVKKDTTKSRTQVAAMIGMKLEDVSFILLDSFVSNGQRDYFLKMLHEKKKGETLEGAHIQVFNGKELRQGYGDETVKIKGKAIPVKPIPIKIKQQEGDFLLLPQDSSWHGNRMMSGGLYICCATTQATKVAEEVEKLRIECDPIKNSMVTIGSMLEIIELKEKFDTEHVVITDYVRQELDLVASMFKNYKALKDAGIPFKRGILFSGDPGTGKTTTVNALAKRVLANGGTVFVASSINPNDTRGYSLEGLYKFANQFQPSLVVLEDFDILAGQRRVEGGTSSELLNVLEGNLGVEGVVTVATTNRLEVLDDAAKRHGRIDKIYAMDLPNATMKEKLLELHMAFYKVGLKYDSAMEALKEFLGQPISGAAISSIVLCAKQRATVEAREVTSADLIWAADGVRMKGDLGFIAK